MIKSVCNKCKKLNILKLNIQGKGKIQMPCEQCGHKMVFGCDNKIIFKQKEKTMEQEAKETGFIDRLLNEKDELGKKMEALQAFTNSELYNQLSLLEKTLLVKQHEKMMEYYTVLAQRLSLYQSFDRKAPQ